MTRMKAALLTSAARSAALVALVCVLALALTFTLTPEPAFGAEGDEGSAEAPSTPARIISTPADLLDFAREVNGEKTVGGEKLPARSFAGEVIELAADLDLSTYPDTRGNWKAIAPDNSHLFEGSFNGNGHTIKGLRYASSMVGNYLGLFGRIKGATIKDLRLEGAITLPSLTSGSWPVALLAASDAGGSTIEDVEVEGSITITREASTPSFTILDGGVALGLARRAANTRLIHVTTKGAIDITGAYGISVNSVAGVAAGQHATTFIECGNEADITIDSTSTERISFISGVGSFTGSYYRCYNRGDITVTGPQTDWSYVAGISSGAGSGTSLFSQCYNTGDITGIHFASGITHGTPLLTVLGCYNTGTITSPRSGTTVSAVNNGVADAASKDNYALEDTVKGMRPEADTGADRSAEEFRGEGLLASLNAAATDSSASPGYVPLTGTEDFPRLGWELGRGEPVITETDTEPSPARIRRDESVTLSLSATSPTDERAQGSGGTLSYQWYKPPYALAGWGTAIEGAEGPSYLWSPEVADAAGYHYFYCVLTNTWTEGEATASKSITGSLFIVSLVTTDKVWKPVFSAEPRDTWYIQSDEWAASPVLSVELTEQADTPEAHVGDITYQWYSNTTESIEGATKLWGEEGPSFSPPINTVGTTWYFCEVTNTYEDANIVTAQSAVAKAVVWDYGSVRPVITAQPRPAQYVRGETEPEELSVEAKTPAGDAGADGTLSFQWYYNRENTEPDPEADILVAGADSSVLTPDTDLALDTYYYYCVVTNTFSTPNPEALGQESHALSNKALVALVSATAPAKPVIWSASPGDRDYRQKETPEPLTVTADLGDAQEGFDTVPRLSYQWYANTTGTPPEGDSPSEGDTSIEGATEPVYTPPPTSVLATTFYYCIVTNTFEKVKTASTASSLAAITVSPLRIYTVEDLKAFADFVTAPSTPQHYYDDITLVLEADLNLEEGGTLTNPWVPLGSWQKPFSGTFDGKGHTISGLHSTGEGTGGLFGVITGATIENLIVRGEVRSSARSLCGVVFSLASSPTRPTIIRNVGSEVSIFSTYAGNVDIGGIIASTDRDSTTAGAGLTLEGCYYRGAILTTATDMYSTYHTGGIIGSAYRYVYLRDCYNAGTIAASGSVGGIAGGLGSPYPDCLIENCYNRGAVTYASGTVREIDPIGAIAGNAGSVEAFEHYSNTWYLSSSALKGCYYDYGPYRERFTEVIRSVSAAVLRSTDVLDALNAGRENAPWKAGEDYPRLSWEAESSSMARIVITTSPLESQTVTRFGEVSPLTVTSRIEGGSGTLSYRWYKSPTGSFLGAEVIEGVSGASFTPPSDTTGRTYYFCEVTGTLEEAGVVRAITRAASVEVVADAPVDLSGFSVTGIDPLGYVYTGVAITAPLTVTDPATSLPLTPDEDYTLAYSPNVSAGAVSITITGKDAYTGELEAGFLIRQAPLTLTLASHEKVYGKPDPAFTYAVSGLRTGDELTGLICSRTPGEDRGDYLITLKDAALAREGVEVTANYDIAYASATLTINPRGLTDGGFVITGIEEKGYPYTGSVITPALSVTDGTTILGSASDYTLSYHANTQPGTASIIVTGRGNYRGELRAGFTILPPDVPKLPENQPWPRLDGGKTDGGRYDTMQAIVNEGWKDTGSPYVIVASGANFPDALAASSLAGIYGAPVILTEPGGLTTQAADTIEALGADRALIIGGDAAVAPETVQALEGIIGAGNAERISGDTRIATALAIYEKGKTPDAGKLSWSDTAIIANGFSFADALSISPFANATRSPLFLSTPGEGPGSGLDVATLAALSTGGFKRIIITGGTSAVPAIVEDQLAPTGATIERWSGESRYETSVDIVERSLVASGGALTLNNLVCATGTNYPDALAGGAFAGHTGTVLLLVHATENGGLAGLGLISKHRDEIGKGYVLGGAAAVPGELLALLEEGGR